MICDKELLVGYLYDEVSESDRQEFERHLGSCRSCRAEVEGLRATRTQLALWGPPERELGFEIVQRQPSVSRSRLALSAAWGLAAAAMIVLGVSAAIANLDVRVGSEGLVIRTGWNGNAAPATSAAAGHTEAAERADAATRAEVQAILQRLGKLENQLSAQRANSGSVMAVSASDVRPGDADLLRRMRDMIAESEKRQQSVLATRVVQSLRELEAVYRTELVRFQQGIAQNQGLRDAEVIRQRDMLNHVARLVSQQR